MWSTVTPPPHNRVRATRLHVLRAAVTYASMVHNVAAMLMKVEIAHVYVDTVFDFTRSYNETYVFIPLYVCMCTCTTGGDPSWGGAHERHAICGRPAGQALHIYEKSTRSFTRIPHALVIIHAPMLACGCRRTTIHDSFNLKAYEGRPPPHEGIRHRRRRCTLTLSNSREPLAIRSPNPFPINIPDEDGPSIKHLTPGLIDIPDEDGRSLLLVECGPDTLNEVVCM